MISALNGEVSFDDGLSIQAHVPVAKIVRYADSVSDLPVPQWKLNKLGVHRSNRGDFDVSTVVDDFGRVTAVFLSHSHSFYEEDMPLDGERRVFHEGLITLELFGQHEFPWGHVFCRFDAEMKRDWLVLVYNPFLNVPLCAAEAKKILHEHELASDN